MYFRWIQQLILDPKIVTSLRIDFASMVVAAADFSKRISLHIRKLCASRLLSEATWILTGQIGTAVGGIVGVPLLAHCLRPEDYGSLALGGTVAAFVQQISFGPIANAGQRFYAVSVEINTLAGYARAARRMLLIAGGLVAIAGCLAIAALVYSPWHASVPLACWSLGFAILSGLSGVFDSIQSAARQRAIVAWHQGVGVWLRFGLATCFARFFGGPEMAMAGFALSAAIILVSQVFFLRRVILSSPAYRSDFSPVVVRTLDRQMWIYAWPFGAFGLFTWGQIASDRWALQSFTTTRSVGIYQALYQLGYYPISMATAFLMQLIQPILFSRAGAGTDEKRMENAHSVIHLLLAVGVCLSVVCAVLTALVCKPLFRLMMPPAYGSAAYLLPFIAFGAGIFACGQIASLKHTLSTDPRSIIAPKIVTAVLGTCLNFAGAYLFGIAGVVIAGIFFSIAYCVWVLLVAPKPCLNACSDIAVPPAA